MEQSANIFVNYRREDSAGYAGRLFDRLSSGFPGRIFMDIDNIEPGVDFGEVITQAVGSCEILIVVIGKEWLSCKDADGRRRLDNPDDFVRMELAAALERNIRVVPVLVNDAPMPRAKDLPGELAKLARRNAIELSDARWAYDVDRLMHTIVEVLKGSEPCAPVAAIAEQKEPAPAGRPARSKAWIALVAALVLSGVMWAGWKTVKQRSTQLESANSRVQTQKSEEQQSTQPENVNSRVEAQKSEEQRADTFDDTVPVQTLTGAILTQNDYFFSAANNGGMGTGQRVSIRTDARVVGPNEKFKLILLDRAGHFTLQTPDGLHYVTAVNNGGMGGPNDSGPPIHTGTVDQGPWETFVFERQPDGAYAIRTTSGYYFSVVDGGGWGKALDPIHTDSSEIGPSETFKFVGTWWRLVEWQAMAGK